MCLPAVCRALAVWQMLSQSCLQLMKSLVLLLPEMRVSQVGVVVHAAQLAWCHLQAVDVSRFEHYLSRLVLVRSSAPATPFFLHSLIGIDQISRASRWFCSQTRGCQLATTCADTLPFGTQVNAQRVKHLDRSATPSTCPTVISRRTRLYSTRQMHCARNLCMRRCVAVL